MHKRESSKSRVLLVLSSFSAKRNRVCNLFIRQIFSKHGYPRGWIYPQVHAQKWQMRSPPSHMQRIPKVKQKLIDRMYIHGTRRYIDDTLHVCAPPKI